MDIVAARTAAMKSLMLSIRQHSVHVRQPGVDIRPSAPNNQQHPLEVIQPAQQPTRANSSHVRGSTQPDVTTAGKPTYHRQK